MTSRPNHGTDRLVSRRQMVGLLSAPVAAAALATCSLATGETVFAAAPQNGSDANLGGSRTFNIRDFGAKGDGKTMDTAAVQAAIDACNKDRGGTVLVPAGTFLIGTIELKSNVTLHVAAAGKLFGSGEGKDYHAVDAIPLHGDTTLEDGNWALLFAVGAANVTIEGPGMIDGNGARFHPAVRGTPSPAGLNGNKRPYLLLFHQCTNLTVRNVDLFQSGYHCVRVIQSSYVQMDGIHIHNRVAGNNDGFHFVSAQYVNIINCNVECQDDACALFGSCKFITVTNSSFSTRWSVFRLGGGSPENITVSNCILYHVHGCPIKFQGTAGSVFQNISFSNLILQECTGPISISIGRREGRRATTRPATQPATRPAATEEAPTTQRAPCIVRNISFSNIHGTVTTKPEPYADIPFPIGYNAGEVHSAIVLNCVHDAVMENISLDNIHLTFGGGGTAEEAAHRDVPQVAGEYFELGPIPAYGLYARNVRGLTLNNVRFQVDSPDLRPALILDNVEDASITGLSAQANQDAESLLRFINTKDALVTSPRVLTPAAVFLHVEGSGSAGILIDGGDISKAAKPLAFADNAEESSVKLRA